MKGPCPLRPLDEHEEDDDDDQEAGDRKRIYVGPPARRAEEVQRQSVLAEAEAFVLAFQQARAEVEWLGAKGPAWDPVPLKPGIELWSREALLALAIAGTLTVALATSHGRSIRVSLTLAARLESRLSGVLRQQSAMRGRGAGITGFVQGLPGYLQALSGQSP